jgi:hypothetical protein
MMVALASYCAGCWKATTALVIVETTTARMISHHHFINGIIKSQYPYVLLQAGRR